MSGNCGVTFQVLNEKNWPRIYYAPKMLFRLEERIKTFQTKKL